MTREEDAANFKNTQSPENIWIVLISMVTWIQSVFCICIAGFDVIRRCFHYPKLFGNIYWLSICMIMFLLGIPLGRLLRQGEMKKSPGLLASWMVYVVALTASVALAVIFESVDVTGASWHSISAVLLLAIYIFVNGFALYVVYLRWIEIKIQRGKAGEDQIRSQETNN